MLSTDGGQWGIYALAVYGAWELGGRVRRWMMSRPGRQAKRDLHPDYRPPRRPEPEPLSGAEIARILDDPSAEERPL